MDTQEHLALLDKRLDRLSVGRRLIASLGFEPSAIAFALHEPELGASPERPALRFQLEVALASSDDGARSGPSIFFRAKAVVSNAIGLMVPGPRVPFELALALPPEEAEAVYYRDAVADAQQAASDAPPAWLVLAPAGPPHPGVRAQVERIFMLPAVTTAPGQANVTYTARVIGHRLTRQSDRYAVPGSGQWTLLRVVNPGDGWVALNLWEGWGEAFSAGRDDATTVFGHHLARAIA